MTIARYIMKVLKKLHNSTLLERGLEIDPSIPQRRSYGTVVHDDSRTYDRTTRVDVEDGRAVTSG
jgi:hypothetical protein